MWPALLKVHGMQKPPTTPKSFSASTGAQETSRPHFPGLALAFAGYLLYQLPPGLPPTWLHSDDNAFSQPVLGRGLRHLLCLQLDAQPALQLCNEPLLGWGPAQGGRVQPAARGGFPGHGMHVTCLPAPPDHRADLGVEGKAVTIPFQARSKGIQATLGCHRGGESRKMRSRAEVGKQEADRAEGLLGPCGHLQVSP